MLISTRCEKFGNPGIVYLNVAGYSRISLSSCMELNSSGSSTTRQRKYTRKSISGPIWRHQPMLFGPKIKKVRRAWIWVLPTMLIMRTTCSVCPVPVSIQRPPSKHLYTRLAHMHSVQPPSPPIIHKICVHLAQIITRLLAVHYILHFSEDLPKDF